jgi:hypothetical protein
MYSPAGEMAASVRSVSSPLLRTFDDAQHLSNIPLHRLGVVKTADAIALIVTVGSSKDLRAWRRLADLAAEWSVTGRPASSLINPGDTADAQAVLERPVAGIDDAAGLVREFTTASRRHNWRKYSTGCALRENSAGRPGAAPGTDTDTFDRQP